MPEMQQNTYLSHAKEPEHFGFRTLETDDGLALFEAHAHLHPNQMGEIKLSDGQLPVINIRGHARRIYTTALLDTSSPASWMEFSTSQKFRAVFLGTDSANIPYSGTFNTGDVSAYAAVVSHMQIDTIHIENTPLYVRMATHTLGPLARGITSPDIGTVLGYDVLQEFEYLRFNSQEQQLELSSTTPYSPNEDLLMTTAKIVAVEHHGLAVEGSLLGKQQPIILDFAGDYFFSRGDVKVNITKQVSLGDVVFRNVPTLVLPTYDAPARAGRRMLETYNITICPKKGVVYFERFPE
ncbi:hypothetical protein P4C99_18480 [Pontiellaceae bacterium B1224]|nr:hypothetical protein [Pontiellaceae bacterium B1224]